MKLNYGYSPESCWIAHVKELCGLEVEPAWNRAHPDERQVECPIEKQKDIRQALVHFDMI